MSARIIIIEDDAEARGDMMWILETPGCTVIQAERGEDAIGLTARHEPDGLVISKTTCCNDVLDIIRVIHMSNPGLPIFLTVPVFEKIDRAEAVNAGVNRIFTKPLDVEEVLFFFARILGAACGL